MTIPPDFTPHDGGPCPVDPDTMVSVVKRVQPLRIFDALRASDYHWPHQSQHHVWDIIAYKVEPKL
jgi:hypothetical protein